MANVATKITATPNWLTYGLAGDGTVGGPTIASATLLADMVDGPLKDAWSLEHANQGIMRSHLLGGFPQTGVPDSGGCRVFVQLVVAVADGAFVGQIAVDVDVDAVTPARAELNIGMSDTTGQIAFLHIFHTHSAIQ